MDKLKRWPKSVVNYWTEVTLHFIVMVVVLGIVVLLLINGGV